MASDRGNTPQVFMPPLSPRGNWIGQTPFVGSRDSFGLLDRGQSIDTVAPVTGYSHTAHLDLTDDEDRQDLCNILDTIRNTQAELAYCQIREEDWSAMVIWITYQREPADQVRGRQVNLVMNSNQR